MAQAKATQLFGEGKVNYFVDAFTDKAADGGKVRGADVAPLMRSLGLCPTEASAAKYRGDADQLGGASLDAFLGYCCDTGPSAAELDDLAKFFAPFDTKNSGTISHDIFRSLMQNVGEPFTQAEVDEMIRDVCNDAKDINYKDFLRTILQR